LSKTVGGEKPHGTPVGRCGGKIGLRKADVVDVAGYFSLNPTIDPRIVSTAS